MARQSMLLATSLVFHGALAFGVGTVRGSERREVVANEYRKGLKALPGCRSARVARLSRPGTASKAPTTATVVGNFRVTDAGFAALPDFASPRPRDWTIAGRTRSLFTHAPTSTRIALPVSGPWICNPADPDTWQDNWPDHLAAAYIKAGMVNQAADFVAGKL